MKYTVPNKIIDLQAFYTNYYLAQGQNIETVGTNNISIKASIEYNGVIYPMYFNGLRTITLAPGGTILSDPVPIDISANTDFYIRTYVSVNSGEKFPTGLTILSTRGEKSDTTDMTDSGTLSSGATVAAYHPSYIIGKTKTSNAVLIIGDSIAQGTSEYNDRGYIRDALYGNIPFNIIAVGGQTLISFQTINRQRRIQIAQYCKYAICEYGTNDFPGTATVAELQAQYIEVWTALVNRGLKVYQTTITPRTSSTDSWATTTNQTVNSKDAKRIELNEWIRTCPAPLSGYFEAADFAETARNSGIWKAGYTADGIHPNTAAHQVMAACIDITKFVEI